MVRDADGAFGAEDDCASELASLTKVSNETPVLAPLLDPLVEGVTDLLGVAEIGQTGELFQKEVEGAKGDCLQGDGGMEAADGVAALDHDGIMSAEGNLIEGSIKEGENEAGKSQKSGVDDDVWSEWNRRQGEVEAGLQPSTHYTRNNGNNNDGNNGRYVDGVQKSDGHQQEASKSMLLLADEVILSFATTRALLAMCRWMPEGVMTSAEVQSALSAVTSVYR